MPHRNFDREAALKAAISLFAHRGFDGTTTEALVGAMQIPPQTLSQSFGNKRALYLEALRRHNVEIVTNFVRALNATFSAFKGIEGALMDFAGRLEKEGDTHSLGLAAISDFGHSDEDVSAAFQESSQMLTAALERVIAEGKATGEIHADVDTRSAASLIGTNLVGMRVMARAGAPPETIRDVARLIARSLK
jgi:AcrR family transcriptional regulator